MFRNACILLSITFGTLPSVLNPYLVGNVAPLLCSVGVVNTSWIPFCLIVNIRFVLDVRVENKFDPCLFGRNLTLILIYLCIFVI